MTSDIREFLKAYHADLSKAEGRVAKLEKINTLLHGEIKSQQNLRISAAQSRVDEIANLRANISSQYNIIARRDAEILAVKADLTKCRESLVKHLDDLGASEEMLAWVTAERDWLRSEAASPLVTWVTAERDDGRVLLSYAPTEITLSTSYGVPTAHAGENVQWTGGEAGGVDVFGPDNGSAEALHQLGIDCLSMAAWSES